MACADIPQLCQTRGIGVDKAMIIKAAFALAKRLMEERPPKRRLLERPEQVAQH
jgi:DNA repair protein RadC